MTLSLLLNWRLHLFVIAASLLSEYIGIIKVPLGPGALLLLPLFYAFIIAVLFNPNLFKSTERIIPKQVSIAATPLILLAIMPFIARFGSTIGPAIDKLIQAGPALLLQELGNLGTMLIALPVAVLVLKMGRETIGATFSIAREPNIAIISDKYGLKGPEGVGVMGVYVVNGAPLLTALPGMVILYLMSMIGLVITRYMPFYLPGVAWVSLVSILATLPWFPGSAWIVDQLSSVNFLAIVTPVLAYAGLALSPTPGNRFQRTPDQRSDCGNPSRVWVTGF